MAEICDVSYKTILSQYLPIWENFIFCIPWTTNSNWSQNLHLYTGCWYVMETASQTQLHEALIQTWAMWGSRTVNLGKVIAVNASRFQGSGTKILPARSATTMALVSVSTVTSRLSKCGVRFTSGYVTFRPDIWLS